MNYPQSAAKDLAVIRSLMERATLYRAISGPTALFGSLLALAAAAFILAASPVFKLTLSSWHFVILWLAALATTGAFNSSEERRVGQECTARCRSRWPPDH